MLSATAFPLHNIFRDIYSVCLHTSEQILPITHNQLSEATEEAYGHGTEGRGQRFPGRSSLVYIIFSTENKKLTFLTCEHPQYRL